MKKSVVVIGAGMGGLTAALRLAREGFGVQLLEARAEAGGLASGNVYEGFSFDAGPYILLDRPGLEWAFSSVGLKLAEHIELRAIDHVYSVASPGRPTVNIYSSDAETARELEQTWPGSGELYLRFVRKTGSIESIFAASALRLGAGTDVDARRRALASRGVSFAVAAIGIARVTAAAAGRRCAVDLDARCWAATRGSAESLGVCSCIGSFRRMFLSEERNPIHPLGIGGGRRMAAGVEFRYRTKVKKICTDGVGVTGVESNDGERVFRKRSGFRLRDRHLLRIA